MLMYLGSLTLTPISRSTYPPIPHVQVTVFDFPIILETTEKRVGNDLLGAGPKTVEELREIHAKLKVKYQQAIEEKEQKACATPSPSKSPPPPPAAAATPNVLESAGSAAQDVFAKFSKSVSPPAFLRKTSDADKSNDKKTDTDKKNSRPTDVVTEEVDFQQPPTTTASSTPIAPPDLLTANSSPEQTTEATNSTSNAESGWANVTTDETTGEVTTAVGEFCIDDDDEDEDDL